MQTDLLNEVQTALKELAQSRKNRAKFNKFLFAYLRHNRNSASKKLIKELQEIINENLPECTV